MKRATQQPTRKAVVLLSGGLDSYTAASIAKHEGYELHALTVHYGQRHRHELSAARALARALGVAEHLELNVDLSVIGGSALTGAAPIPKARNLDAEQIPPTYVPARNTILLSLALAWAEVLGASAIYIGVNAVDYSGYPDCRPEFIAAFERLAAHATKVGVEGKQVTIQAPLMHLSKGAIIRRGLDMGLEYGLTHSCYDPGLDGKPCGSCDSCVLRARGFHEAGVADPLAGN